ncbi:MAG: hypothetical protein ACRDSJ_08300 [Rubrobacteraceae bacterium]
MEIFDLHSSALVLSLAAGIIAVLAAFYFAARRGLRSSTHRLRNLSPEKIAAYHRRREESQTVESLAASIIERANEIKRALEEEPSEIQIEMCAIGYRKCANDMITLTHLLNEDLEGSNFTRRWKLKRARKRAVESLSAARENLPPNVLKETRQES